MFIPFNSALRPTAILCDNKCFYSLDDSIIKPTLHGCEIILHWAIHVASQTSAMLCFQFCFFSTPFYHHSARLGCSRTTTFIGQHLVYEHLWQGNIITNHFTLGLFSGFWPPLMPADLGLPCTGFDSIFTQVKMQTVTFHTTHFITTLVDYIIFAV